MDGLFEVFGQYFRGVTFCKGKEGPWVHSVTTRVTPSSYPALGWRVTLLLGETM